MKHTDLIDVTKLTRDEVVPYYADLLDSGSTDDGERLNELILAKWSPSGLVYIKEKAWKIFGLLMQSRLNNLKKSLQKHGKRHHY